MKNIIVILIVFVLVMALAGCGEEIPPENSSDLEPEASEPIEAEPDNIPENPTAEFTHSRDAKGSKISVGEKIGSWTLEELKIDYFEDGKIRNITGYFSGEAVIDGFIKRNQLLDNAYDFSADEYEREKLPYLVSPEGELCDSSLLVTDIPEGLENSPELRHGEELYCRITVNEFSFDFGYRTAADGLSVTKIEPLSTVEADFTLGPDGEAKTLRLGDKIGDWTVKKVLIYTYGETDGEYYNIGATFSGDVTLTGYAEYNTLGTFIFYTDESEWGKMPLFTSEYYVQDHCEFIMRFPEGKENPLAENLGEKVKCKVTLSEYHFDRAPMMAMPRAVIEEIEIIE